MENFIPHFARGSNISCSKLIGITAKLLNIDKIFKRMPVTHVHGEFTNQKSYIANSRQPQRKANRVIYIYHIFTPFLGAILGLVFDYILCRKLSHVTFTTIVFINKFGLQNINLHSRLNRIIKLMVKKIRVIELFAGVGGFRIGLEGWQGKSPSSNYTKKMPKHYEVVWSNQWEPSTKMQHASMVYERRFGASAHSNEDIATVDISELPDFDMIVGGFPCQDYSVATTLKNSAGLIGKKGVLWWSIHRILTERNEKPKYLLLENVDRLLNSPSKQRGRDFAIILQSLNELGYAVEWRVINAADYGMPQRRRRTFILAYSQESELYNLLKENTASEWILSTGTLSDAFPVNQNDLTKKNVFDLKGDIVSISEDFNKEGKTGIFQNAGVMIDGLVTTIKTQAMYNDQRLTLRNCLDQTTVPEEFYIEDDKFKIWEGLKKAKSISRISQAGFPYKYSEGNMACPDELDRPSRTIITGEGGNSPSRFKHVIQSSTGMYRRLTPTELERLNMFPENHTLFDGITNTKRAFFMGNALVVGVIEKIGVTLFNKIKQYERRRKNQLVSK